MATKTELVGGAFQDSQGNLLVNGYLKMRLSQDSEVNSSLICAGIEITIQLDANGDAVAGQFIWGNDVLLPVNSFYIVTGYTAKGQPAWGPNNQQVLSNSYGLFDMGTWIPNQVFVWTPPPQPISLEINGMPASSQTVQNFVDTATVTFTDNGGGSISATASAPPPPTPVGVNVCSGLPWAIYVGARGSGATMSTAGFTYSQVIFANAISTPCLRSQITINVDTALSAPITEMCIIETLKDSLNTVSVTPITFAGSPTPTFTTGDHTSDVINLAIDALHDYYVCFSGNVFGGSGKLTSTDENNLLPYFGGDLNGAYIPSTFWAVTVGAGQGFSSFNGTPNAFGTGSGRLFLKGWVTA